MPAYHPMNQTYQQSFVNQVSKQNFFQYPGFKNFIFVQSMINQNMIQTQNNMMSMPQQHGNQNQYMNQQVSLN